MNRLSIPYEILPDLTAHRCVPNEPNKYAFSLLLRDQVGIFMIYLYRCDLCNKHYAIKSTSDTAPVGFYAHQGNPGTTEEIPLTLGQRIRALYGLLTNGNLTDEWEVGFAYNMEHKHRRRAVSNEELTKTMSGRQIAKVNDLYNRYFTKKPDRCAHGFCTHKATYCRHHARG